MNDNSAAPQHSTGSSSGAGHAPRRRSSDLVGALAATTTVSYGVLFYAYGVLLVPMEEALGWRRSTLAGAFSLALVMAAVLTVPVGRWLDRHPPRALLTTGAVVATLLVALWSRVSDPALFYVVWVSLGACMAVLFYEPAFTILTKAFTGTQRRRALTAVTLLAGLASTIFGPLTAWLESTLGWRGAVLALAALLGAVTVPLFLRTLRPAVLAGGDGTAGVAGDLAGGDWVLRRAMSSPQFWYLTVAYLLSAVTTFAVAVHLVAYLRGQGWTAGTAATALGAVGFVQVAGRSAFARLTATMSAGRLGTWVLAAKAVGLAFLLLGPGVAGVVAFVAVYGAANGLQTLTRATVIGDLYGATHYGSISAVMSAVTAIGGALAPFGFAAVVELADSDAVGLWVLVAVSALAAAVNAVAVGTRRWTPAGPAAPAPVPADGTL